MNQETVKISIAAASGLIVGGLIGYAVTQRVLSTKYEELLDVEVAKVKKFYKEQAEEKIEEATEEVVEEYSEETKTKAEADEYIRSLEKNSDLVRKLGYDDHDSEIEEDEEDFIQEVVHKLPDGRHITTLEAREKKVVKNVPPIWDNTPIDYTSPEFKEMLNSRTPNEPYIVTVDEFMDDNPEFEKQTLTYFEGDDTLCDSRDQVIPDIESTVGFDALTKFGLYSKDSDIVYVRNERISSDFEIAYDERPYVEAIAGFKTRHMDGIE